MVSGFSTSLPSLLPPLLSIPYSVAKLEATPCPFAAGISARRHSVVLAKLGLSIARPSNAIGLKPLLTAAFIFVSDFDNRKSGRYFKTFN